MPWETKDTQIAHRISEPGMFMPDSFRTKTIGGGISLILGKKDASGPMMVQSIRFEKDKFTVEEAKKWWEKHKDSMKYSELPTLNIPGVEIFAVGTHNGDTYSDKDLEAIVSAFKETKDILKPYLKLGHGSKQKLLDSDELPAAGWIDNLRKEGEKLIADFCRVPQKIYDLIKSGAYKRVSCEIYWNAMINGKKYPYALKACALLGGTTPAVQTLNDILSLYVTDCEAVTVYDGKETEVRQYEKEIITEDKMEELKAAQEKLAGVEKALAEATATIATLTDDNTKAKADAENLKKVADEATTKLSAEIKEKKLSEINVKVDKLISDKKILPVQKEKLVALLSEGLTETKTYKLGDKEVCFEELILSFAADNTVSMNTEQQTEAGKKQEKSSDEDEINKYAVDNKLSYREAYIAVMNNKSGK